MRFRNPFRSRLQELELAELVTASEQFARECRAMADQIDRFLCSVRSSDETHGMTLEELLGDEVGDLIRANKREKE